MGDVDSMRKSLVPTWSLKKIDQALWYLGALLPETDLDSASRSCLIHRVRPIPSMLGVDEDEVGWPCLLNTTPS